MKVMDPVRMVSAAGTSVMVATAGGGGWGNPLDRDPASVREDVLDEFVSIESARNDYGVIINPETLDVDVKATEILRAERRNRDETDGAKIR